MPTREVAPEGASAGTGKGICRLRDCKTKKRNEKKDNNPLPHIGEVYYKMTFGLFINEGITLEDGDGY